jgi:predicted GIY-YIG superfamily endonuclease
MNPLASAAVGVRRFDRKFGAGFVRELPEAPAVYLFKDADGRVLYAGKARNVRRRLAGYRTAGRRKAQRKMRALVREACALEVRVQPSERDALLVENELIRTLRPRFNVDGAFDFLYPAIGTGAAGAQLRLCFTTDPAAFAPLALRWHGSFRPRARAREAFDALVELLGRIGHLEPRTSLPEAPRIRGSRLVALRRTPAPLLAGLRAFLDGESDALLAELFALLLERHGARREARAVQEALDVLQGFYRRDVLRLRAALHATGEAPRFVPQAERDALFIAARSPEERAILARAAAWFARETGKIPPGSSSS